MIRSCKVDTRNNSIEMCDATRQLNTGKIKKL